MRPVLLHAFPLDERMWEPQLEVIREHDPYAPRLYGRGSSVDEWAAQILSELDGDLVPVGASMGGYVALAMARQAPERVAGVLLAGSRADADSPARKRFRAEMVEKLRAEGPPENAARGVTADELIAATEALRDRRDATDVVASFTGPLLLCAGDQDELLSLEEARRIVELAPQGRLEVFEGAGHFLTLDQPEHFNHVLLDFLSQWR